MRNLENMAIIITSCDQIMFQNPHKIKIKFSKSKLKTILLDINLSTLYLDKNEEVSDNDPENLNYISKIVDIICKIPTLKNINLNLTTKKCFHYITSLNDMRECILKNLDKLKNLRFLNKFQGFLMINKYHQMYELAENGFSYEASIANLQNKF